MIDWASFTEVIDALLWLFGATVVLGTIVCALFVPPDDDRGC